MVAAPAGAERGLLPVGDVLIAFLFRLARNLVTLARSMCSLAPAV